MKKENKKISIALSAIFLVLTIQYFVLITFNLLETSLGHNIQLLSKGFVALSFLYALPIIIKKHNVKILIVYLTFLIVYLFNYTLFINNQEIMKSMFFDVFFMSAPILIYSLSITDVLEFKETMYKFSLIIYIFGIITTYSIINGDNTIYYSMSLSYYLLFPAMFTLEQYFKRKKIRDLIISITSLFMIIMIGSRGPLVPYILFFIIMSIKSSNFNNTKIFISRMILILLIIFFFFNFKNILLTLINVMDKIGWNSRTLSSLLSEEVSLSGREFLFSESIKLIKEKPILGYGLFSDYFYLNKYVHNFILELFLNYGIILGTVILVLLMILIYKSLKIDNTNMILMLILIGVVSLFYSKSYITFMPFWMSLGLMISVIIQNKTEGKNNEQIG